MTYATEALKAIGAAAEGAKASQGEAFQTVKSSIDGIVDVLSRLADKADTDEARIKIAECVVEAAKLYVQIPNIIKDMNANNNNTWKTIARIAVVTVSVIGAIAKAVLGGRGGRRSNSA